MNNKLAVIGGTGLDRMPGLEVINREVVHTPYGEPSGAITTGRIEDCKIMFLPRHGYAHFIPPHAVNYRANIWALAQLGVTHLIGVGTVRTVSPQLSQGALVIPDQIIDYTYERDHTFHETFHEHDLFEVSRVDFSEPYCTELRRNLAEAAGRASLQIVDGGTYAAVQGPRFETLAEIKRLRNDGADIVGMTGMPETSLAAESGICYAACSVVINKFPGHNFASMDEIQSASLSGMQEVRKLILALAKSA